MIDVVLLFGKLLLLALMYLFLFAAVRAGMGLVTAGAPARKGGGGLTLAVTRGPSELLGSKIPITGRTTIGRAPDSDIVIGDDFVSTHHAVVASRDGAVLLEDLGSTNGTFVNGSRVMEASRVGPGDVIEIGRVAMEVRRQ